jgi:D-sedoheptulose 7-phosphate isomerase
MSEHLKSYFQKASEVAKGVDWVKADAAVDILVETRDIGGRVFVLGVGGSAGNASHMVNDLRKLCGIETYSPIDNVSELTARTNDEGWDTTFVNWLRTNRITNKDVIVVLSVGGGSKERGISMNIVHALEYAHTMGCSSIAIVGKPDGYAAQTATVPIVIPMVDPDLVTPISEGFQAVVWHGMVSDPKLQMCKTTW